MYRVDQAEYGIRIHKAAPEIGLTLNPTCPLMRGHVRFMLLALYALRGQMA